MLIIALGVLIIACVLAYIIYVLIYMSVVEPIKNYQNRKNAMIKQAEREQKLERLREEERKAQELAKKLETERIEREKELARQRMQEFLRRIKNVDRKMKDVSPDSPDYSNSVSDEAKNVLEQLAMGKKYCVMPDGDRKDSIIANWLKYSGKKRALVVTSPDKISVYSLLCSRTDEWCGKGWRGLFKSFDVVCWKDLSEWYYRHSIKRSDKPVGRIDEYAIVFDDVHLAGRGNKNIRGMMFLNICEETDNWVGFSSMLGSKWCGYVPLFVAAGMFKSESDFDNKYALYSYTPNGGKFVSDYWNTEELAKMWSKIAVYSD